MGCWEVEEEEGGEEKEGGCSCERTGGGGGEEVVGVAVRMHGWSCIMDELKGVGRAGGCIICVCANVGRETGGPCGEDREQNKMNQGNKCERKKASQGKIKDSVSSFNSAGDSRS